MPWPPPNTQLPQLIEGKGRRRRKELGAAQNSFMRFAKLMCVWYLFGEDKEFNVLKKDF
jgi:hypothetical protein